MGRQHAVQLSIEVQCPSKREYRRSLELESSEFLRYLGGLAGPVDSPVEMERIKSFGKPSHKRYEQLSGNRRGTDHSDDSSTEMQGEESGGEGFLVRKRELDGGTEALDQGLIPSGNGEPNTGPSTVARENNGQQVISRPALKGKGGKGATDSPAGSPSSNASSPRVSFSPVDEAKKKSPESEMAGKMWRESSYDFGHQPFSDSRVEAKIGRPGTIEETQAPSITRMQSFEFGQHDPTSRVIGEFLRRQKDSGELGLDYDPDMEELTTPGGMPVWAKKPPPAMPLPALPETSDKVQSSSRESPNRSRSISARGSPATTSDTLQPTPLEHHVEVREYTEPSFLSPSEMREAVGGKLVADGPNGGGNSFNANEARVEVGKDNLAGGAGSLSAVNSITAPESATARLSQESVVKSPSQFYTVAKLSTRLKSRSRLADPPLVYSGPTDATAKSGCQPKSGQLKSTQLPKGQVNMKSGAQGTKRSGLLGKVEEEEDDPFKDADLPDKYKKRHKFGFWTVFQWTAFFVIIGALICSLTIDTLTNRNWLGLELWKWSLVVLVIFCGRLISGWLIMFVVFFVERNFLLRKKVLYFVYSLRKGVQNCLWLGWVLLAWHFILDPKVSLSSRNATVLKYVTRVLVCLLIGAFLLLLKTFLVKILASSFHVAHYFERIQESLFNQYVLETLSGPPVLEIEETENEEKKLVEEVAGLKRAGATAGGLPEIVIGSNNQYAKTAGVDKSRRFSTDATAKKTGKDGKEGKDQGGSIDITHLNKMNAKNVSAWNMKRLVNIVRQTGISTLAQTLDESAAAEESQETDISSEWQAKAAGRHVFKNVAKPGHKVIVQDDLLRFMREEQAIRAFALFDGGLESGKITKQALKNWVINVYRERRALALSLNDTKTAVNKLHRIIDCLVAILVIIIWLLVLGIATTELLLFLSSQLLLIVFVFGNTCKTIFEATIFVFVMHPFDVGDRCVVDGVQMVVEEMNILTTVFLRYDNEKIWYPNTVLATKPISNFFRSPNMGDSIEFQISASTPLEKITSLKEKVARHLKNTSHHWQEKHVLFVKDIVEMNKMNMVLGLGHTMNHQEAGEKWMRRSEMLLQLRKMLQDLEIEYRLLPQEVKLLTSGPRELAF